MLLLLRFALGPLVWWSVLAGTSRLWFLAGFLAAFLSDVFDGIIARRLNVSTPALRQADGWVDTWFYGWVIASLWVAHRVTLIAFAVPILIVLSLQVTEWIFGFIKFRKLTSYHAYSAKAFGIALFVSIVCMMGFDYAGWVLWAALIIGCINSVENWLMTLILKVWTTDVPSAFHAWKLTKPVS